jgi:hypothetical protein
MGRLKETGVLVVSSLGLNVGRPIILSTVNEQPPFPLTSLRIAESRALS